MSAVPGQCGVWPGLVVGSGAVAGFVTGERRMTGARSAVGLVAWGRCAAGLLGRSAVGFTTWGPRATGPLAHPTSGLATGSGA